MGHDWFGFVPVYILIAQSIYAFPKIDNLFQRPLDNTMAQQHDYEDCIQSWANGGSMLIHLDWFGQAWKRRIHQFLSKIQTKINGGLFLYGHKTQNNMNLRAQDVFLRTDKKL